MAVISYIYKKHNISILFIYIYILTPCRSYSISRNNYFKSDFTIIRLSYTVWVSYPTSKITKSTWKKDIIPTEYLLSLSYNDIRLSDVIETNTDIVSYVSLTKKIKTPSFLLLSASLAMKINKSLFYNPYKNTSRVLYSLSSFKF